MTKTKTKTKPAPTIEIRRSLVLSTAHLTEAMAKALAEDELDSWVTSAPYGWMAYVGEDIPSESSSVDVACINAAFALARIHACSYVVWDSDGDLADGLPSYSW